MYFILWLQTCSQKVSRINPFWKKVCLLGAEVLSWRTYKVFVVWRHGWLTIFSKPEISGIVGWMTSIKVWYKQEKHAKICFNKSVFNKKVCSCEKVYFSIRLQQKERISNYYLVWELFWPLEFWIYIFRPMRMTDAILSGSPPRAT